MNMNSDRQVVAARRIVRHVADHLKADLSVRLWNGEVLPLGAGARDDIQIVIARPSAVRRLMLKPSLMTLFELFATGDLKVEGGQPAGGGRSLGPWTGGAPEAVHGSRPDSA